MHTPTQHAPLSHTHNPESHSQTNKRKGKLPTRRVMWLMTSPSARTPSKSGVIWCQGCVSTLRGGARCVCVMCTQSCRALSQRKHVTCVCVPTAYPGQKCAAGTTRAGACSAGGGCFCKPCSNSTCDAGQFRTGNCTADNDGYTCKPCSNLACPAGHVRTGTCTTDDDGHACVPAANLGKTTPASTPTPTVAVATTATGELGKWPPRTHRPHRSCLPHPA